MKKGRHQIVGILLCLVISISAGLAFPTEATAVGTGPDDALSLTNEWPQLEPGESQWYAFYYAGDGSQIQVQLEVEPEGGIGFAVWTPEQIQRWGLGEYVEPVGRGSADSNAAGALVWSGNFNVSGTYYVVLEHGGIHAGTSHYHLDVSGTGVSLSEPAITPAPEPVAVQEEQAAPGEPTGTLVFQTTYGGTFYTINVDGTELDPVTNGIDPIWSPDGEQVAFVRWEEPRGVWIADVDKGDEWRVFDWTEARYPSWSPDGEQIVFSRQYGVVPSGPSPSHPDSQASTQSALGRPGDPAGAGGNSSGSATWNLGVVNICDGSFWEPLPNSDVNLTPDWSADGGQIVFAGNNGLMVQSVDGQEVYQLTSDPKDTSPAWSPDGSQVAYVHRQHDHWEIHIVDVDSGQQTRLTDTPAWSDGTAANSVSPAWSPDGNYIAFLTDRSGEWEIWVVAAIGGAESDGSNARPLFDTEVDTLSLEYAFAGERAIDWTW